MVKNITAGILASIATTLLLFVGFAPNKAPTPQNLAGAVETVRKTLGGGFDVTNGQTGTIEGYEVGFTLKNSFTLSTTSPVRAKITNTSAKRYICDGDSLYVRSDASGTSFAPSFKFVVGTTTATIATVPGQVGYSASLLASTTVATSTDTISGIGAGWMFIVNPNESLTLSVGDYVAAIASSTYYGNWAGQFGVNCVTLASGQ